MRFNITTRTVKKIAEIVSIDTLSSRLVDTRKYITTLKYIIKNNDIINDSEDFFLCISLVN